MISSTVPSGHSPAGYPGLEIPPQPASMALFLGVTAGTRVPMCAPVKTMKSDYMVRLI